MKNLFENFLKIIKKSENSNKRRVSVVSKNEKNGYKSVLLDFRNSGNIVCPEQKIITLIQKKIQKNTDVQKSKEIIEILSRDGCLQRFSIKGKPFIYIKF
tara:strand:+ start:8115 stop:8414 length:300 start_codon:yes stop_codon:yes gene_type:complete